MPCMGKGGGSTCHVWGRRGGSTCMGKGGGGGGGGVVHAMYGEGGGVVHAMYVCSTILPPHQIWNCHACQGTSGPQLSADAKDTLGADLNDVEVTRSN